MLHSISKVKLYYIDAYMIDSSIATYCQHCL